MEADGFIEFIQEIDEYELGEYKDEFIKRAYELALEKIGDPEEQAINIMCYMSEYLEGASEMYQKIKDKSK